MEGDDSDADDWDDDYHHESLDDAILLLHTDTEERSINPEEEDHGGEEDFHEPGGASVGGRVGCHGHFYNGSKFLSCLMVSEPLLLISFIFIHELNLILNSVS